VAFFEKTGLSQGLLILAAQLALGTGLGGCANLRTILAADPGPKNQGPIANPFEAYMGEDRAKQNNVVLRTKKGDRSVEVELPNNHGELSDFTVPMSPAFREDGGRGPASDNGWLDERYKERGPGLTDREIVNSMPRGTSTGMDDSSRREIESGLGVMPAEDEAPVQDKSYLAALDHVKQLYKTARFEAGLLELDEMVRAYPTDPKLYEMRGTLLDRLGRTDLALKSWNQALRLNPGNESLKRFVERKQQKRSVASP